MAADIVALVIGNNEYQREEDKLDTPVNDAHLMKRTLEALPGGADVKLLIDATKEDIQIALNALKVRAQGAKLALVFYSGHGMDGQPDGYVSEDTFLLPVDASIPDVNYLDTRAISLSSVLTALKNTPVTARAVFLDCCRSGAPKATAALAASTKNFGDIDERVKAALGKAVVPDATLIAFAASPGRKAAAFLSESDENSPFTKFLTEQLATGSGNLRDLVEAAAEITETRTGKRQVPYVIYSGAASAIRQITFRSSPAALNIATPAMDQIKTDYGASELAAGMTQNASKVEDASTSSYDRTKPEMTWQDIEEGNFNGWKAELINGYDYVPLLDLFKFYRFRGMGVGGKVHRLASNNVFIDLTAGTKDIVINNINFSTSLPILEKKKMAYLSRLDLAKLVDPVLRPSYIHPSADFKRVIIDPAGGGDGEPASYDELTLKLALAIKGQLSARGFDAVLTRHEGEDVSLAKRIQIANSLTPAVYIRLTYQESGDSTKSGIESLALTPLGATSDYDEAVEDMKCAGNKWDACNVGFATAVHAMVISRFKFVDLGLRRSRHPVLTGLNCPAFIFRGGYLSNQNESKLIHSPTFDEALSIAIADAIQNFKLATVAAGHNLNKSGNNSIAVADQESLLFKVQRVLSFTGFYDGEIDGVMGKGTRQALINYQKSQGLEASGELSDETLNQLGLKN